MSQRCLYAQRGQNTTVCFFVCGGGGGVRIHAQPQPPPLLQTLQCPPPPLSGTRNMSGYIIRGSEFWLDPVNQFTQLKSLNHLTWDTIHAVGIANLVYNTSVAAGRCGTTPSVGSNNNKWLFAAPTPASTLTASATEMLLGMYYTASTARLDDPSTFDGWSYEDVVRMRYLFGGQFGGGGPHIGCTVQVCNASFARPFCVADAPLGPWTSARGEGLPALKDVALARNGRKGMLGGWVWMGISDVY